MRIAEALASTPVVSLDLSRHVTVGRATSVEDTVAAMASSGRSCACIVDDNQLVGIFTQRDYLQRVIGRPQRWSGVIAAEMSEPVQTVSNSAHLDEALAVMNEWWVRSVPVLDPDQGLVGSVSFYSLMTTIGNLVRSMVMGDTAEPTVHHGLTMVDLTGLNHSPPILVRSDTTVANAVQHMRVRGFGSVLVVDDRDNLLGELTEFDLMTKVGCSNIDLHSHPVSDFMVRDPRSLEARASLADVVEMALTGESSHVPMTGESGRPIGVASVRDVASFVEMSIEALA